MYESYKELPDFSDFSTKRAEGQLLSIAEIRNRHLLMQKRTLMENDLLNSDSLDLPVRLALKREWLKNPYEPMSGDLASVAWTSSRFPLSKSIDFSSNRAHRPSKCWELDEQKSQRDVRRIVDENLISPKYFHHRNTLDNINFLENNFYRDALRRDLTVHLPRKSYAGSIVERSLYW